jgi:hypothetical protein
MHLIQPSLRFQFRILFESQRTNQKNVQVDKEELDQQPRFHI